MTTPRTRDDFVQAARRVPKNVYGLIMGIGYLLFILGVAALIHGLTVSSDTSSLHLDWRIAAGGMVFGGLLIAASTAIVERDFRKAARDAGYSPTQIREIEDEAERLNAEED